MRSIHSLSSDGHRRVTKADNGPSEGFPPCPLTAPDTEEDEAPEHVRPVGVDGWPLPDPETRGGSEPSEGMGDEDRRRACLHASAIQTSRGDDA